MYIKHNTTNKLHSDNLTNLTGTQNEALLSHSVIMTFHMNVFGFMFGHLVALFY